MPTRTTFTPIESKNTRNIVIFAIGFIKQNQVDFFIGSFQRASKLIHLNYDLKARVIFIGINIK